MRRSGSHDLEARRRSVDVEAVVGGVRAFEATASVTQTDSPAEGLGGTAPTPPMARFISRALSSHVSNVTSAVAADTSPPSDPANGALAVSNSVNDGAASLISLPPRHFLRQFRDNTNTIDSPPTVPDGNGALGVPQCISPPQENEQLQPSHPTALQTVPENCVSTPTSTVRNHSSSCGDSRPPTINDMHSVIGLKVVSPFSNVGPPRVNLPPPLRQGLLLCALYS